MSMNLPMNHPEVNSGRVGVLIVNLGTPDDLSVKSVRKYLKEFLSDSRVIGIPKVLWWPILNGIILNTRPKKSLEAYRKIWRNEDNTSPLRFYTKVLADAIGRLLPSTEVAFAMRYGQPSIADQLNALKEEGCDRILIVPLYPQYSATTNATVNDKVFDHLKTLIWQPSIRIAAPWYRHPAYIEALRDQVARYLQNAKIQPDRILLSFHGLPKQSLQMGDPYYCHCQVTGRLLTEALGLPEDKVLVTFQSRFGPAKWLEPYTADTLIKLPKQGVKRLLVLTPGFATDCLETLEEIAMEGKELFMHAGGEQYDVLPCLNDSDESVVMMQKIISEELSGWS